MKNPDPHATATAELRRRAEAQLQERRAARKEPPTMFDLLRLHHELEVHQIELEMQNEELQRARVDTEAALEKYADLYDFAPTGYFTLGADGVILAVNFAGALLAGFERARLLNRRFALLVAESDRPVFNAFLQKIFAELGREFCEVTLEREGASPLFVRIEAVVSNAGQECRAAVLDITERHQAAVERDRLIAELQQTAAKVKMLSGLLPICASCKKIREDNGYWTKVESYLAHHSEATFSHGLCPECAAKLHPDYMPAKEDLR